MKKWLLATRPWSFTASVIPLTLGAALAWASDAAHAGLFLLTLLGGVAVQTGTNMLNIYGDYRSGVDTEASAHGESPILLGLISPEAMRRGGLIALCVAFAVGIVLGFACGWPIDPAQKNQGPADTHIPAHHVSPKPPAVPGT